MENMKNAFSKVRQSKLYFKISLWTEGYRFQLHLGAVAKWPAAGQEF